jgi:predicted solute-binding protein
LIEALLAAETRPQVGVDRKMLDQYLAMYANDDTLAYPADARRAVDELFARGRARGLIADVPDGYWAP